MKNLAYLAAERALENSNINIGEGSFTPERTRALYTNAILFGQLICISETRGSGRVLPEFQETFGEELRQLAPAIKGALAGENKLVLMPSLPMRGGVTMGLCITEEPDNGATMSIAAEGDARAFPAAFVAAIAAYGHAYTSGLEFWPMQDIEHVCVGDQGDWAALQRDADEAARR